jgi:hypothetical protein
MKTAANGSWFWLYYKMIWRTTSLRLVSVYSIFIDINEKEKSQ